MLAIALAQSWHLSWWEWHLLMLLAFGLVAQAAWREWQREGSPAEIWADLYEGATWGHEEEATVLFADLQGFTAWAESHDETQVTAMLNTYFEAGVPPLRGEARNVRTIGDAVMAYFTGDAHVPRAAQAALEFQRRVGAVSREHPGWPRFRAGVNTGRVNLGITAGAREETVRGDAVNVAARLEQGAQPGEVLLGEETYRLVRDAVVGEEAPLVVAKGKSERLAAHRLVSVLAEALERRHEAPMIGRKGQREVLQGAFANVVSERSCHLFTILGAAGVGKSRLAQEFLAGVDATVVGGRCLSYGEGISYWPVTEVVKQLVPDGDVAGPLASILGDEAAAAGSPAEIAWAFRKLLESRAAERPLVAVFDDLH
jgi:class 3 adenylate cyclase